jgi:hypothetical protein
VAREVVNYVYKFLVRCLYDDMYECLNVSDLPQPHTSSDARMTLCVPD